YIGLCHFALQNWNRAIEALNMVGTFVDPDSPTAEFAEAGRRFYVKIEDNDIPILVRTGRKIVIEVRTNSGDRENVECVQITEGAPMAIGSIPTEAGVAKPGDKILQLKGGDEITVKYTDFNTDDGVGNVVREHTTKVVSSATIRFTLADFEAPAPAAYLGQPVYVSLHDLDLDKGPAADTVSVRVIARYKKEEDPDNLGPLDLMDFASVEEDQYEIRDQIQVVLNEDGKAPVHTGKFVGSFMIEPVIVGVPVDQFDDVLSCDLNDQIIVFYEDNLHMGGDVPREITARIEVAGEIDTRPKASQNIVEDAIIRARKNIIEATAYLELTEIFKSMGLMKHAREKSDTGMERVQEVILEKAGIPSDLKEEAFKIKWSLEIAVEDFTAAVRTCQAFSRLFPHSSFADDALLQIGLARLEEKNYMGALQIFRNVLSLPQSHAKPEAQFQIAETMMKQVEENAEKATTPMTASAKLHAQSGAMQAYKVCAERYPDSPYAGKSLGKLVDYYYETKDYTQAENLLEQIFQDYPDADFLDSMLLKWVIVAFRTGNFEKAREKCDKLLFEYPNSEFANHANKMMPAIQKRLEQSQ
ncbi:MAG: tetratricopeptide repeat protein, partial [Lentisphaerae bacterium]|nr:tetratricopeptide repeat protein [Lentisphaerota bacterium]